MRGRKCLNVQNGLLYRSGGRCLKSGNGNGKEDPRCVPPLVRDRSVLKFYRRIVLSSDYGQTSRVGLKMYSLFPCSPLQSRLSTFVTLSSSLFYTYLCRSVNTLNRFLLGLCSSNFCTGTFCGFDSPIFLFLISIFFVSLVVLLVVSSWFQCPHVPGSQNDIFFRTLF